jgi:hypothetical protein
MTERGAEAMAGTSVLDVERVAALLERLDAREQAVALDGLRLLARAARELEVQR